jgi:methyl-accepting chemotaxis protein
LVESRLSTEKLLFEAENLVKQMRRQERRFLVENNAAPNIKEEVERLFQDYMGAFDVALASTVTAQELENNIAAASHELARLGEGLQTQVARFKMGQ